MLKHLETTKLFYDEYAYKLGLMTPLAHLFREKKWKYCRDELDKLQSCAEENLPLVLGNWHRQKSYDLESFEEAKILFNELTKTDHYKIRVENPILALYSNDKSWLKHIASVANNPVNFYEPKYVLAKNQIIVDYEVVYSYRITFHSKPDPGLAKWIESNPNLASAGSVCLDAVKENSYVKGLYFYVRDEKILALVNLMLGKNNRIDKIVSRLDLDK